MTMTAPNNPATRPPGRPRIFSGELGFMRVERTSEIGGAFPQAASRGDRPRTRRGLLNHLHAFRALEALAGDGATVSPTAPSLPAPFDALANGARCRLSILGELGRHGRPDAIHAAALHAIRHGGTAREIVAELRRKRLGGTMYPGSSAQLAVRLRKAINFYLIGHDGMNWPRIREAVRRVAAEVDAACAAGGAR